MKKSLKLLAALFVAAALFAGCDNGSGGAASIPSIPGFVYLAGASVTASVGDPGGPFTNASTNPVTVAAFYIAETELTYARWKEVYDWARSGEGKDKGYRFYSFRGQRGGNFPNAPATHTDSEPVTEISWLDAMVWCNAASEREGLTPVYLTSETDRTPVRDSTRDTIPVYDESANGYRLPTEAEWEFAARGGNPSADKDAPWNYKYAGTNDDNQLGDYAWYKNNSSNRTHNVGEKKPNSAGLYDMSGNVEEWCWDEKISQPYRPRVVRGGTFGDGGDDCTVAYRRNDNSITNSNFYIGFRLARNAN